MKNFRNLIVWRKAHALTRMVYECSSTFPREEIYGMTSQIRRACASVPTNIAEGCGRNSDADFRRFMGIAMGSASELEYLLLLAHDLKLICTNDYQPLADNIVQIKMMLASLIKKLKADS